MLSVILIWGTLFTVTSAANILSSPGSKNKWLTKGAFVCPSVSRIRNVYDNSCMFVILKTPELDLTYIESRHLSAGFSSCIIFYLNQSQTSDLYVLFDFHFFPKWFYSNLSLVIIGVWLLKYDEKVIENADGSTEVFLSYQIKPFSRISQFDWLLLLASSLKNSFLRRGLFRTGCEWKRMEMKENEWMWLWIM